jgi:hypothetical protein
LNGLLILVWLKVKTGRGCCPGLVRGGLFVLINAHLFSWLGFGDSTFGGILSLRFGVPLKRRADE